MVLLLFAALLASACSSSGGSPNPGQSSRIPDGSGHSTTPPPPPSSPSGLGTVQPAGANATFCLPGDKCTGVKVDCPDTGEPAKAILDIVEPTGSARGLLVFLSGGGGNKLWSQEAKQDIKFSGGQGGGIDQQAAQQAESMLRGLQQQGYMTVQVVWQKAWLAAPLGNPVGPARLGCRPATLLKWLYDTSYQRLGAHPSALGCGFCVTGNSGG
ncbi:MAG TPA: hypothetical protein VJO72_12995, partial [Candidatus Dormibacteraeota bacterium]|nr:hypothetical protein [Candidatus Dormibacteraeota bacterium]